MFIPYNIMHVMRHIVKTLKAHTKPPSLPISLILTCNQAWSITDLHVYCIFCLFSVDSNSESDREPAHGTYTGTNRWRGSCGLTRIQLLKKYKERFEVPAVFSRKTWSSPCVFQVVLSHQSAAFLLLAHCLHGTDWSRLVDNVAREYLLKIHLNLQHISQL
jgi:hypothetical protein